MLSELKALCEKNQIQMGISRVADKKRKFRTAFLQAESALYYSFVNLLCANVYSSKNESTQEILSMVSRQKSSTQKTY